MPNPEISSQDLPQHIAVIMDGNGRWAKKRHQPRLFGHRAGVKAVRETITCAARLQIPAITLFAFSSENWKRPKEEVSVLMDLFLASLTKEIGKLHENNLKLQVIGNKSQFSDKLQKKIQEAESLTQDNTGTVINIAANYGGQWDITQAFKNIALKIESGDVQAADITEDLIGEKLCLAGLPPVDLMIRTSGEQRISNFLLWQIAYAELYFTDIFWPDFNQAEMLKAISWFVERERRFGCTSEQLQSLMAKR